MTGAATLRSASPTERYVSPKSGKVGEIVSALLQIGGESTSLSFTEREAAPLTTEVTDRFNRLSQTWRNECKHLSSVKEMVMHPAYQQIIGMGSAALPPILKDLERSPDHWFWALRSITEKDPVSPAHRGNVTEMTKDWLEWGRRSGLLR